MYMQVVKSRYQQFVAEIHHLPPPVQILRQFGIYTFYETVRSDHNISAGDDLEPVGCWCV